MKEWNTGSLLGRGSLEVRHSSALAGGRSADSGPSGIRLPLSIRSSIVKTEISYPINRVIIMITIVTIYYYYLFMINYNYVIIYFSFNYSYNNRNRSSFFYFIN